MSRRSLYRGDLAAQFSRVVEAHADRAAVLFGDRDQLSYRELDRVSNQAARFMLGKGLRRGDRVCIRLEKGPAAYAVLLGCIKAGIAYYAVDPASPQARAEAIFAQCPPTLIFSETNERLGAWTDRLVPCRGGASDFCAGEDAAAVTPADPPALSDTAYIMFTSGSTGLPKGAVITHSNLRYFVEWAVNEYGFTPADRHTHINPIYFDNSVFDVYSTFFSGGTLVPFTAAHLRDPFAVVERIERFKCTVSFSVPSLLLFLQTTKALEKGSVPSLRKIIFGGEGYPKARLSELYDCVGPAVELINVYGPTECTCICSTYAIGPDDFKDLCGFPPIGALTGNFSFLLLDGDRPVGPGEVGELCLGGPCVGHGYFNQPELTRRAFIQNPLNGASEERLYRTGDLMRLDPADGKLWFVGRKDFQVKHQGYRIELEEIQHALAKLPGVAEAAVVQMFEGGASKLVGFVASPKALVSEDLRRGVAEFVPKYMVPAEIVVLDRLPKNANGKTDRKALLGEKV